MPLDEQIEEQIATAITLSESAFAQYDLRTALLAGFELAEHMNKYIDTVKPWELKNPSDLPELARILYQVGEALRVIAHILFPFFPQKMGELLGRIGLDSQVQMLQNGKMDESLISKTAFFVSEKGVPLYMRIATK